MCTEHCGNGAIDVFEDCDDSARVSGDGCDLNCMIEKGWKCDGAPSVCVSSCGDGTLQLYEDCDDTNTIDTDGCKNDCTLESPNACYRTADDSKDEC